ncbi:hypothetical protein PG988_003062 [Apiospora saccharicola]
MCEQYMRPSDERKPQNPHQAQVTRSVQIVIGASAPCRNRVALSMVTRQLQPQKSDYPMRNALASKFMCTDKATRFGFSHSRDL